MNSADLAVEIHKLETTIRQT